MSHFRDNHNNVDEQALNLLFVLVKFTRIEIFKKLSGTAKFFMCLSVVLLSLMGVLYQVESTYAQQIETGYTLDYVKITEGMSGFTYDLDAGDQLGVNIETMGDLDGDGYPELSVGANGDDDGATNAGAAYILFLNEEGTVRRNVKIANGQGGFGDTLNANDAFGRVGCKYDLNLDGIPDLVVGATGADGATGNVWIIYLNRDGTVLDQHKIAQNSNGFNVTLDANDEFGHSVTCINDRDGDGVAEIVVGARNDDDGINIDGGQNRGALYVLFPDSNGQIKRYQKNSYIEGMPLDFLDPEDQLGHGNNNAGDVDSDGRDEILAGAIHDDDGAADAGAAYLMFIDDDGVVERYVKYSANTGIPDLAANDKLGHGIAMAGDLNSDGLTDILIGAYDDDDGGTNRGSIYHAYLDENYQIISTYKVSQIQGGFPDTIPDGARLGYSASDIGDRNGDGHPDMAVAIERDNVAGANSGSVAIFDFDTPEKITGMVWEDINMNGVQDPDEPGMSGIEVQLVPESLARGGNRVAEIVTTDDKGRYLFSDPDPQPYSVQIIPQTGYIPTLQDAGDDDSVDNDLDAQGATDFFQLRAGEIKDEVDGGLMLANGVIGDRIWVDDDGDGIRDSYEPGYPNMIIRLLDDAGVLLDNTISDADGFYSFEDLFPNQPYIVEYDPVPTMPFTSQNVGSDVFDSDVDVDTGRTDVITLSPGAMQNRTIDVGLRNDGSVAIATPTVPTTTATPLPPGPTPTTSPDKASLGDRVWDDANNNGIQNSGEVGISGMILRLLNGDGTQVAEAVTSSSGNYAFFNIEPGTYFVEFGYLADMALALQNVNNDVFDSDFDPNSGRTAAITLGEGELNFTVDAGLIPSDLAPTPAPTAEPTPVPTTIPTEMSIYVGDYTALPDNEVTIIIEGRRIVDLATATFELTYDPNILSVTGCNKDPDNLFNLVQCNPSFAANKVRFSIVNPNGVSGDLPLAEITFKAIGENDQRSPIDIILESYGNVAGESLPITYRNGEISIEVARNGDVTCNGTPDATDALLILQYNIGLRSRTDQCAEGGPVGENTIFIPACDVSGDEQCNSIDALFIIQCSIGIETAACPADGTRADGDTPTDSENGSAYIHIAPIPAGTTGTIELPLEASLGDSRVGAATISIEYDERLIQINSCATDPDELFGLADCNVNFGSNELRFTLVDSEGVSGDMTLATVSAEIVGTIEQDTALAIYIHSLTDETGNDIIATIRNHNSGSDPSIPPTELMDDHVHGNDPTMPPNEEYEYGTENSDSLDAPFTPLYLPLILR